MATSINQIIERYTLDASQYVAASRRVTAATGQMAAAAARARRQMTLPTGSASPMAKFVLGVRNDGDKASFGSAFGPGAGLAARAGLTGLKVAAAAAGAELAALTVTARASFAALEAFGELEALKSGFTAIVGDAREAEAQLKRLRELGKNPGLDFEDAIRGSRALQEAGLSAAEAEETLKQFANAGALAGSSTEEVTSTLLQLRQALRKGKIDGDELRSVLENMPYAAKFLKQAFGTSVGMELAQMGVTAKDALRVIVEGLATIPRAADGVKNSIKNIRSSWSLAVASIGEGVNTTVGGLGAISKQLDVLEESGAFKTLGEKMGAIFATDTSGLESGLTNIVAGFQTLVDWIGIAKDEMTEAFEFLTSNPLFTGYWVKKLMGPVIDTQERNKRGVDMQRDLAKVYADRSKARELFAEGKSTEDIGKALEGRRDAAWIDKQREIWAAKPQEETEPEKPDWEEPLTDTMNKLTRAQERNTAALEETARSLERMVFGGGALGRYGVSPVELGSRPRTSQVNITVAADGPTIIREVMQLKRAGVL